VILPLAWAFIEMARGVPELSRENRATSQVLPPRAPVLPDSGLAAEGQQQSVLPAGRVSIDVTMAEFSIEPGPAGDPIRVEADYDSGVYELVEEYKGEGELGWSYSMQFRPTVSWVRRLFAGSEESTNRVRLILPEGTPMSLVGDMGIGESRLELGGLWLSDVNLNIGIGEHRVMFSKPLPQPLEELRLNASIGEVKVTDIGNASPHRAVLDHNLGEVLFDLRGQWMNDGDVEVTCGIGECRVRLPGDEVNVDLVRASVSIGEARHPQRELLSQAPEGAPTLRVDIAGTLGEVSVDD
jgi:hypothetical protein